MTSCSWGKKCSNTCGQLSSRLCLVNYRLVYINPTSINVPKCAHSARDTLQEEAAVRCRRLQRPSSEGEGEGRDRQHSIFRAKTFTKPPSVRRSLRPLLPICRLWNTLQMLQRQTGLLVGGSCGRAPPKESRSLLATSK